MTIKEIREARGAEEARVRALQLAIGEILNSAELNTADVWNVLVNMLCGISVEHEIDKEDVMTAVSTVYDMQSLHMAQFDTQKPN